ncbi:LLM class flavin-dependent oxidoreductase [Streptomyces pinistramenti]|uniref:LLM class flavin-dependent oxidoreductase n=1 Tax=Streptomyces pinistramenti TaxID=2884812 RepID=UPI001D075090|nr:LLM class flavin-dependent oxidoreductase [Streptomyces pinistramenti]MCB5906928.1 LLM class flavin-dependent oxidoreductase [Streptomyces pinistramenti]
MNGHADPLRSSARRREIFRGRPRNNRTGGTSKPPAPASDFGRFIFRTGSRREAAQDARRIVPRQHPARPVRRARSAQRDNVLELRTVLEEYASGAAALRRGEDQLHQLRELLAPTWPGALLAKEIAGIDGIAGGRLTLGIGVGSREDEFTVPGHALHGRGTRLESDLATYRKVWGGEPAGTGPNPAVPSGTRAAADGGLALYIGLRAIGSASGLLDPQSAPITEVSQRTRQGGLSQYLYHQGLPDVQNACQPG